MVHQYINSLTTMPVLINMYVQMRYHLSFDCATMTDINLEICGHASLPEQL